VPIKSNLAKKSLHTGGEDGVIDSTDGVESGLTVVSGKVGDGIILVGLAVGVCVAGVIEGEGVDVGIEANISGDGVATASPDEPMQPAKATETIMIKR
jgi:hypothetical protein